jgi:Tfp pilus assembly protein PilN
MIDINLIPDNLRKRNTSLLALSSSKFPVDIVIGIVGGILALLVLTHVLLLLTNIFKVVQYKHLQSESTKIQAEKERVEKVINDMRTFQSKTKSIEDITSGKGMLWSEKLNIISDSIVKGVWLSRLELNDSALLIEGRALSRKNEQIITVHGFASSLKSNARFLEKFDELEPGSIQLMKVGETEVASFLITCHLK